MACWAVPTWPRTTRPQPHATLWPGWTPTVRTPTPDTSCAACSTAPTWPRPTRPPSQATPWSGSAPTAPHSDAGYVLRPLLYRADLAPDDTAAAARHALTWLDTHRAAPDAGYVLRGLLDRADLAPADPALP